MPTVLTARECPFCANKILQMEAFDKERQAIVCLTRDGTVGCGAMIVQSIVGLRGCESEAESRLEADKRLIGRWNTRTGR